MPLTNVNLPLRGRGVELRGKATSKATRRERDVAGKQLQSYCYLICSYRIATIVTFYSANSPIRPTIPAKLPATTCVGRAAKPDDEDDAGALVEADEPLVVDDAAAVELALALVIMAVELELVPDAVALLGTEVGTALPASPALMK